MKIKINALFALVLALKTTGIYSQVGINTTTPDASLQIQSTPTDGLNKIFEVKDTSLNSLFSVYKNKMIAVNNQNPYATSLFDSANNKILFDIEGSMLNRGHYYNFVSLDKINHPVFFGASYRGLDIQNPEYVRQNDVLNSFISRDFKSQTESIATSSGYGGADIIIKASENYTSTNKGTKIEFNSTKNGETTQMVRMTIENNGNVAVGSIIPDEKLHIDGALKISSVYTTTILTNNSNSPVPNGGPGTIVFQNGHFFGWNGANWKQLDN